MIKTNLAKSQTEIYYLLDRYHGAMTDQEDRTLRKYYETLPTYESELNEIYKIYSNFEIKRSTENLKKAYTVWILWNQTKNSCQSSRKKVDLLRHEYDN